MVAVKFPNIMSRSIAFENISIRVLEWLGILCGCKLKL